MKNIFKLSNLYPLLLVVYIIKSFILPPSHFDFGVIALMSLSSVYKLKLDKDEVTDKDRINGRLSELDKLFTEKLHELEKRSAEQIYELKTSQDSDRMAYETKFSTLNIGLQRQSNTAQQQKGNYGWGK